jgi:hypothetical protein
MWHCGDLTTKRRLKMKLDDYIDRLLEAQTQMLNDAMYSTKTGEASCAVCEEIYSENNPCWRVAHECGNHMPAEEAYVCSESCAKKWADINWEEIEEFNQLKEG